MVVKVLPLAGSERFESLGHNCEVGFVLEAAGNGNSGMFRWLSTSLEATTVAIRRDFEGFFAFENLVPHAPDMVRDVVYDIAFHSRMHSARAGENLTFVLPEEERRPLYEAEAGKIKYFHKRFHESLRDERTIFILKESRNPDPQAIMALWQLLSGKAGRPVRLLWVKPAGQEGRAATVQPVTEHILCGYVSSFAPHSKADAFAAEDWRSLLAQTLEHFS